MRNPSVHRNWQDRRVSHLQCACAYVAELVHGGIGVCRAFIIGARKFRGRSLGKGRRLRLSAKSLARHWYQSDRGRDPSAFELHYRPGRSPKQIDPVFLRLIADHCVHRAIPVAVALRELNAVQSSGVSVHTFYRKLPAKIIRTLALMTRRALREQADLMRRRKKLEEAMQADLTRHRKKLEEAIRAAL
jgi:hypothetical protein